MFKNFWDWLITSSADPQRTSLMIKGVLTIGGGKLLAVLTALCGLGMICLGIDANWLQQCIELITQIVLGVFYLIGASVALVGLIRKVKLGRWSSVGA
jgi:hypothetical protein